jgi:hypothetical protein
MKRIVFTVLIWTSGQLCFCQLILQSHQTYFFNISGHEWHNNDPVIIKRNGIRTDSTYYYQKEHNVDGSLVMVQNFDSLGNITERDEFTRGQKGNIWRITNFNYLDSELFKEEITTQYKDWRSSAFRYEKEFITYEYDSNGKRISLKSYRYPDMSLKEYVLITFTYEYDTIGRMLKIVIHPDGKKEHVSTLYKYEGANLIGINEYDSNGILIYTLISSHNSKRNIESHYKNEESPDYLTSRLYFDVKNRLIQDEYFTEDEIKFVTRSYSYTADDLIEKESEIYTNHLGDSYYTHFYARQ